MFGLLPKKEVINRKNSNKLKFLVTPFFVRVAHYKLYEWVKHFESLEKSRRRWKASIEKVENFGQFNACYFKGIGTPLCYPNAPANFPEERLLDMVDEQLWPYSWHIYHPKQLLKCS